MRVILDTNVFVSGVFFSGPPYQILKAWRDGKLQMVISEEIIAEYRRVANILVRQFPGVDLNPILEMVTVEADLVQALALPAQVCDDPDDDKFLACALTGKTGMIISGDRHLIRVSGYRGITIMKPREFADNYLMV